MSHAADGQSEAAQFGAAGEETSTVEAAQDQSHSNVLGKFRLIAELGRGGMSEVYLSVVAGVAGFNKLTVVKLIKGDLAEDQEFISMFLEEARLSARLNHPNIVQTNEVGQHGSRYFIAMEYLEGQPYSRIVNRLGRDRGLPLGMSLRILSDVLAGLHYAHELRDFDGSRLEVVHRDVSPHNVFVTYDGQVKVVDFGIAKAMNSSHETRTGMLKGKVGYMAPEQARGERVDRRADVFSVGVMLWEAAVGRRMWKGMSEVQVLHQLISGEIPNPRSLRPDVSEQLDRIIMKALAIDKNNRHATAADLQAELDELMDAGNERTTLREVGKRVQAAFEDERVKIKGIIESQIAKSSAATGAYNAMTLPVFEPQRTGEQAAMRDEYGRSSLSPHSGSLPILGAVTGSNPSVQSSVGTPPGVSGSYPSANGTTGSGPNVPAFGQGGPTPSSYSHPHTGSIARATGTVAPVSKNSNRRITFVALAVAGAAVALVVVLYLSMGRKNPDPNAASSATNTAATTTDAPATQPKPSASEVASTPSQKPTASALAPGEKVSIKVITRPKDATLYLDDEKVNGDTVVLKKDGSKHKLRIEAVGYSGQVRDVTAEKDRDIEVNLDRAVGPLVVAPKTPTTTQTSEPQDGGKMTTNPTARPIDTKFPGGGN